MKLTVHQIFRRRVGIELYQYFISMICQQFNILQTLSWLTNALLSRLLLGLKTYIEPTGLLALGQPS